MASANKSSGRTELNEPPNFPIGVRAQSMIYALDMKIILRKDKHKNGSCHATMIRVLVQQKNLREFTLSANRVASLFSIQLS